MSTTPPGAPRHPAYPGSMATALTLDQAADRAGVTASQLEQLFREGRVTGAMFAGDGRWAIRSEDLDAWLATRT